MKVSYKMMGVVLCGAMLLASGCGAKTEESTSSVAASASAAADSVVEEAASSVEALEPASESVPVLEADPAVSEAASEAPAESKAESKAETKAEPQPVKQESAASSKKEEPKVTETKPANESAPAAPAETASLETALKYVGKDVSKLYAAIGKPASSEYASSCIGDGEDGLLYYDGFTVTTYRENGKETVQDAY